MGCAHVMAFLSMRFPPEAAAIAILIIVLPCVLGLLGIGAIVHWASNRLNGQQDESGNQTWRIFSRSVIGLGGLVWLALTVAVSSAPSGPRLESAAVSNLHLINIAEVTYLSDNHGRYGTLSDLIAAGLLDQSFDNTVSGYVFEVTLSGGEYVATAMPASIEAGKYGFYSGADALIYYANAATGTCRPCFPKGMAGARVP
ncbi:MAG TPA: hypothetical protein VFY29_06130 [Terriglobia bacterium]|nr:hypothetical protein [Terriglobia bacterium]